MYCTSIHTPYIHTQIFRTCASANDEKQLGSLTALPLPLHRRWEEYQNASSERHQGLRKRSTQSRSAEYMQRIPRLSPAGHCACNFLGPHMSSLSLVLVRKRIKLHIIVGERQEPRSKSLEPDAAQNFQQNSICRRTSRCVYLKILFSRGHPEN